jgi:hypothetical protein
MKINAYILAADPAWIEHSVMSYYGLVNRIFVSFDENGLGWTGEPIRVDECLARLRAIDGDRKMVFRPGHYARSEYFGKPMENENFQRQCVAEEAGSGIDWVLQIDTDEVVPNSGALRAAIVKGQAAGAEAIEYPAIYLYQRAGRNLFLEESGRFWRPAYGFPGPVAVRPGAKFTMARRTEGKTIRFKVCGKIGRANSRDEFSVPRRDAIIHYSWVRSPEEMRRKLACWGHAKDRDWTSAYRWWMLCGRHPYFAAMISQSFRRLLPTGVRRVRLTRLNEVPNAQRSFSSSHGENFSHHCDLQSA